MPRGRPKGRSELDKLQQAIDRWQTKTGISIYDRFLQMANDDPKTMQSVIKKLLADKVKAEVDVDGELKLKWDKPEQS